MDRDTEILSRKKGGDNDGRNSTESEVPTVWKGP